ncbi:MAG: hypothetical protein H7Z43_11250 [Clostridia bacterium]|nr:hypothetical protein [Deltaproteobacteria bacterium]
MITPIKTSTDLPTDEAYDEAIKNNSLASVDATTGLSDAQISGTARIADMSEKRRLDASEHQRRRGLWAASAIRAPQDQLPVAPAGTESMKLSDLDPYLKA